MKAMMPTLQLSTTTVYLLLSLSSLAISGARYVGVPHKLYIKFRHQDDGIPNNKVEQTCRSDRVLMAFARPKSTTFTTGGSSKVKSTFSSFKSRCAIFCS